MADAQQRIMANLAGLAECVGNMAVTGLLNDAGAGGIGCDQRPETDGTFESAMRSVWTESAPSSPSSPHTRLARALTERIRDTARVDVGAAYSSGLKRTLARYSVGRGIQLVESPR